MKLKSDGAVRYSRGEQRMFALLSQRPRDTAEIADLYYGADIPFNGRHIAIALLAGLINKTLANNEPFQIMKTKRAGPHPMSFWIERTRHSTSSPSPTTKDGRGSPQLRREMPEKNVQLEHKELLLVFPSGTSITDNFRLGLSYEWASNPSRRNHRFLGLYDRKTIRYVGKVEAITAASYLNGIVEYADKIEVGRLTEGHRTRIKRAFQETVVYNLKDGVARRFYLVDTFCCTDAIKTSFGPMRSIRYFGLEDFELSKAAHQPHKDAEDYTSEEMAKTLRGATWGAKAKA